MAADPAGLDAVRPVLRCPGCEGSLVRVARSLTCATGHRFDIARQGYVSLLARRPGSGSRRPDPGTGDSAAMVAAREAFLGAGHYRRISDAVAQIVQRVLNPAVLNPGEPPSGAEPPAGIVVDLAGGTGQHLAVVLDRLPDRSGLVLDLSKPALQRAARLHRRAAAVGADAWGRLPLTDGCAAAVLNIFGPRNSAEIARVLAPGGVLVSVTPTAEHLQELIGPLGMLRVDERKAERLAGALPGFTPADRTEIRCTLRLDHDGVTNLVGMGPTAVHVHPDVLARRVGALPSPAPVTIAVPVSSYAAPR